MSRRMLPGPFALQRITIATGLALLLQTSMTQAALTLAEAEEFALSSDPVVAAGRARARALSEDAVADGQLPDPKLNAGMFNLPVNDFDHNDEPTTQLRLGVKQAFPRGKTLHYRQRRTEWDSLEAAARSADSARQLQRDVRDRFLELYYQVRAGEVIKDTRALFDRLVDITTAHYATGRVSQQDVLSASLELSRLDDRSTRIRNQEDTARAALMKWLGPAASRPIDTTFPALPALPARQELETALESHPVIRAASAAVESQQQEVRIAREQYKPGWSAGVEYRKRFGNDPDGSNRDDMVAAMVTMDLPLFPGKRQDRRLAASIEKAEAAQLMRDDRMRELREMLETNYANWQRLGERAELYELQLLREARANAQASLKAYQTGVTEFTTLMRARITDLNVRLDDLRVRVDRARAQAHLLYLAGEDR